jgi:predicted transcriptional regulator YheO
MDRDDKVAVISYLESKGAFLIRYSMERAAQSLNIS